MRERASVTASRRADGVPVVDLGLGAIGLELVEDARELTETCASVSSSLCAKKRSGRRTPKKPPSSGGPPPNRPPPPGA